MLQNKIDLNLKNSKSSDIENDLNNIKQSIAKLKKEYKDFLIDKEISLLNQDDFQDLILEINRNITNNKNINNDNTENLVKLSKNIIENNNNNNDKKIIKCILLGHSEVGKTTFFNKIINKIEKNYLSTIGMEMINISAKVYDEEISIKLADTAGQERYRSIAKNFIKNVDGILLMFDVTNVESFNSVDYWVNSIKENNQNHIIILVGNKIDSTEKRLITKSEAKKKADQYNIKYYELSCLNGLNHYEILNELILIGYRNFYEKNKNLNRTNSKSFKLKHNNIDKKNNNNGNCNC